MPLLAGLTLALLVVAPQAQETDPDPRLTRVLSQSDVSSLHKKAVAWVTAEIKWEEKDSSKNRKTRRKARDAFRKDWDKKSKKKDILKHMGDVLEIFRGTFPYGRESTAGEVKQNAKGGYHLLAPRGYRSERLYRAVLVLPGIDKRRGWSDPKKYLEQAWKGSGVGEVAKDTFFVLPKMRDGDDYDPVPDLTKELEMKAEMGRLASLLGPFGEAQRIYRFDRSRVFLDCGVGTCGFGIRLATYFPSRFAGLILRHPVAVEGLQLESLAGLPILLLSTPDTKEVCEKLKKTLDTLAPDACIMVEVKGEAPYRASQGDISLWIQKQGRPLYPNELTIAINHDYFGKSFWAEIIEAEPLDTLAKGEWPLLKVKADRENNRITVHTRNVSEFGLYLNDALVDLDRELTIVVNGREVKEKFDRSVNTLVEYMIRSFDPSRLYPAYHRMTVPKEETSDKTEKKDDDESPRPE